VPSRVSRNFADRLLDAVAARQAPVCVGLDPVISRIPPAVVEECAARHGRGFDGAARILMRFCCDIVDAVADLVPCVKLQSAFFESYGPRGDWALREVARYSRKQGLIVILDVKRGDIGSTAAAYAQAFLGQSPLPGGRRCSVYGGDAVTVSPYLGTDGIEPFVRVATERGAGVFVLVRTSNPSSEDVQEAVLAGGRSLYERVATMVDRLGHSVCGREGYAAVGAVVGANRPGQAAYLRRLMPRAIFLMPGYGAQGATAADVVPAFDTGGRGAIVSSSRAVLYAWEQEGEGADYQEAARRAARNMVRDLNFVLRRQGPSGSTDDRWPG